MARPIWPYSKTGSSNSDIGLPTNPHREELRKAIERQAAALDRLEAIKIAQRLELEARGVQRRALAEAIGGLAAAATDSEKQTARAILERARDDLNEAVKEQRQLEKQYTAGQSDVQDAIREVAARVRDVVHSDPATKRLASEFVDLQRQISELRPVMELLSGGMLPDGFRFWRAEPGPPPHNLMLEAWERAIAALRADPDAELPHDIYQNNRM
jgi:predicted nuclease with TOPRIM domain